MKTWWLLGVTIWLAGCGMFGKTGGDDPASQPAPVPQTRKAIEIDKQWTFDVGGGVGDRFLKLTPAQVADLLVIADPDGRVAGLDIADGKPRWRADLDVEITGGVGAGAF